MASQATSSPILLLPFAPSMRFRLLNHQATTPFTHTLTCLRSPPSLPYRQGTSRWRGERRQSAASTKAKALRRLPSSSAPSGKVCLPKFLTLTYSKDELMSNKVRRSRNSSSRRWGRRGKGLWRGLERGGIMERRRPPWSFRFAGIRVLVHRPSLSISLSLYCVCVCCKVGLCVALDVLGCVHYPYLPLLPPSFTARPLASFLPASSPAG